MTRINTETLMAVADHLATTGKPAWARLVAAAAREIERRYDDVIEDEDEDVDDDGCGCRKCQSELEP